MTKFEEFNKKYETLDDFIKVYPIGKKFHYIDHDLWHIVTYFKDSDNHFVVIKSWAKYKQKWVYKVENLFTFKYCYNICNEKKQKR